MNVPVWHDPDAPTERECAGRIAYFGVMVEHHGYERLAAIADNDGRRLQAAFTAQRQALRMLGMWRRLLAQARETAVPA